MGKGIWIFTILLVVLVVAGFVVFSDSGSGNNSNLRIISENSSSSTNSVSQVQDAASQYNFYDDFSSYAVGRCFSDGESFGLWNSEFNGEGQNCIDSENGNNYLNETPKESLARSETHSSLVLGPEFDTTYQTMNFSVRIYTKQQMRKYLDPSPWEVAWVVWHYTNDNRFYYIALKTNGWELGKEDPHYDGNQRFLTSAGYPTFRIGNWYDVTVTQSPNEEIKVYVNKQLIADFIDNEDPYEHGRIGLYSEDASVKFDDVGFRIVVRY